MRGVNINDKNAESRNKIIYKTVQVSLHSAVHNTQGKDVS